MTVIEIPDELAGALDQLAGEKTRSAYASELLWTDVQRVRQREALRSTRGAWKHEDHPELADGGGAYVEMLRTERDQRSETAMLHQDE